MPLTEAGAKVLRSMREQYKSPKKAMQVFYATKNKRGITGWDAKRKPVGREMAGAPRIVAHKQ